MYKEYMYGLLVEARRYSVALRKLYGTGLKPLTENDPLCQWSGPLLPLERMDYDERIKHGTETGYQQHRYYKIEVCDECLEARRIWKREYRQRYRERQRSS